MKTNQIAPSPPDSSSAFRLLDCLADGAYITDRDRKILFWNAAAERITGWRSEEVVGRSCFDKLLAHLDKDGHELCGQEFCPLHRSIVTGQSSTSCLVVFAQCKSQIRLPVEVSVSPIRDEAGNVTGGIEVFRDLREPMQDLLRAKDIQQLALRCPSVEDRRLEVEIRYQPREIVGGDFYRVERLSTDDYAFFIADAMGHGVAAALCTMQLRSLWEEHRGDLSSPARFLGVMNERLHALAGEAGYFATAAYLVYNAAEGRLQCARAGHPAPLVFRCGGCVEPVGGPQFALGMRSNGSYEESTLQLEPDDTLLLFTDGAVELFDHEDHELGIAGLTRLAVELGAGQQQRRFRLDALEERLLQFSNQIHLPDDLTLIKVRRRW